MDTFPTSVKQATSLKTFKRIIIVLIIFSLFHPIRGVHDNTKNNIEYKNTVEYNIDNMSMQLIQMLFKTKCQ